MQPFQSIASPNASSPTAIIIGGSSGLGEALAYALAKKGWRLGLTGRSVERLEDIAGRCGNGSVIRRMDVTRPEEAIRQFEELTAELGGCDMCIVSSGVLSSGTDLLWENERDTIAVNVTGFTALCVAAFTLFRRQGRGHLVGISSIASLLGGPRAPAYNASKAFESIYLDGLRYRAATQGLAMQITCIHPGYVHTRMTAGKKGMVLPVSAEKAAHQILDAIEKGKPRAFVTRRALVLAWLIRLVPDSLLIGLMRRRRIAN